MDGTRTSKHLESIMINACEMVKDTDNWFSGSYRFTTDDVRRSGQEKFILGLLGHIEGEIRMSIARRKLGFALPWSLLSSSEKDLLTSKAGSLNRLTNQITNV